MTGITRRDALITLLGAAFSPLLARAGAPRTGSTLTFEEVSHAQTDRLVLPAGYTASVVAAWGQGIRPGAGSTVLPRSAREQEQRFGYNNDFIAFLPILGRPERGLLCVNHESTDIALMFQDRVWGELGRMTPQDVALEMAAQGHSVVEVVRKAGRWQAVVGRFNRRLTANGPTIRISGPAAGHPRMKTAFDPSGTQVAGTFSNCAGGTTPWGTVLIAEENIEHVFEGDPAKVAGREAANHTDLGLGRPQYAWSRFHPRFRLDEHPNEPNRFGWIVELDPRDPASQPVKRTALGRFKHECATTVLAPDGRVVIFSGDDEVFQHLYRFVSAEAFDPARHRGIAGGALLDRGMLSVAVLRDDKTLEWRPLVHGQGGSILGADGYLDQGDVVIETRRAARLVGATPLDRPEDIETHTDGRIFVMLSKNDVRTTIAPGAPRAPNPSGHVLELTPPMGDRGRDPAADSFAWDILLLGGGSDAGIACPDNAAFDPGGRLFITTDGAPKTSGGADGVWACDVDGDGRALARRFLSVPHGAEATGPRFTPDGRTLFLSVQHPGQRSQWAAPSTRFPDYDPTLPPRPAVVAIEREDGGPIGS